MRVALLVNALAPLVLGACADADSTVAGARPAPLAPRDEPRAEPGVCLRVDGEPITTAAIDRLADDVQLLYPEYTRPHARRLALTNAFLPRLALRNQDHEAWDRARAECAAFDPAHATQAPWTEVGDWRQHGLELWSLVRSREVGAWSEPLELHGRWVRARLDERRPGTEPQHEELTVSLHAFPFLDVTELRPATEAAIDAAVLEIVDPEWNSIVPESWKYRMSPPTPPSR